jgi:predicted  nucleic acid-binding Zn-ribbon protein
LKEKISRKMLARTNVRLAKHIKDLNEELQKAVTKATMLEALVLVEVGYARRTTEEMIYALEREHVRVSRDPGAPEAWVFERVANAAPEPTERGLSIK